MAKIINPYKIRREDIKRPTRDELKKVLSDITDMLNFISYDIKKSNLGRNYPKYAEFLSLSAIALCNKLRSISKIDKYLDEVNSLLRDLIELIVDVFWLYHFYKKSPKNAELLSERFFMFRSKKIIYNNEFSKKFINDPFLKEIININQLNEINKKEDKKITNYEFYNNKLSFKKGKSQKEKNLLKKQRENWRAHPLVITDINEILWSKRCELAKVCVKEIANLKEAPYHLDLKFLSGFTHWDPIQGIQYSEKVRNTLFDRNFNIALCFALDFIALTGKLREIKKPSEKFVRIKHKLYYFST